MSFLIVGLMAFLGVHSVRIVADDRRSRTIARIGSQAWKGAYSLLSLAGLVVIGWGFSLARQQPLPLWSPPPAMHHLASLLTWLAFVLLFAAYLPGNAIKARVHHPMMLAVKLWASAHLLANGNTADVLLFGSFLLWAVVGFSAARSRDRRAATVYPPGQPLPTVVTVAVGTAAWAAFAFWLHGTLFGVRPFG